MGARLALYLMAALIDGINSSHKMVRSRICFILSILTSYWDEMEYGDSQING